ncbi:hypothetical protein [Mesorhizobium sp.]|uniref:hypothetical protein n=1 Tax=Mesorhizobium sp. TaxID=1871066 RepID=UPI000FE639C3|nr:hypothetical protein [Mesorhizobium sp.]RWP97624.1 MAG: hypothetical protein EOR89_21280 [Mesorhizobium sp.]
MDSDQDLRGSDAELGDSRRADPNQTVFGFPFDGDRRASPRLHHFLGNERDGSHGMDFVDMHCQAAICRSALSKRHADAPSLLKLLQRWATKPEPAGDGFWLARWLQARDIKAYDIHPVGEQTRLIHHIKATRPLRHSRLPGRQARRHPHSGGIAYAQISTSAVLRHRTCWSTESWRGARGRADPDPSTVRRQSQ